MRLINALTPLLVGAGLAQATLQIIPGGTWTATNTGRHIQAHGAGITKVGSTYYMIGEDKTEGSAFQNVNCYSSTNLVEWAYVGALLSRTASGDLGPSRVVERPKVIYNSSTRKYVMYLHIDSSNYGEAKIGVATSDSVCGKYTYLGSWRPLGFESRDIGLFQDDDGAAYLLTEDRPNGLRIDALTSDYLNVTRNVYLWGESIESPAILKRNGYYFMFGSRLTGWNANDNVYSYATSLSGPWSTWRTFAPAGSNTFTSQTTFILPVGDMVIYMGDRWVSTNLMRSTYIWLPLTISGTTITMSDRVNWTPNVAAGTWAAGPTETSYEGESATLSGGARSIACTGCSGGAAAGYVGGSAGGVVRFPAVSAQATGRTTVRIKHLNGDSSQRWATVTCNGVPQTVAFLPTADGNSPGSSSLFCNLNSGSSNTISIASSDSSWVADIDRIFVPVN
ncbi:galactan 1, 3-beta-galactosidase [Colletotrichum karsti]|uniref:Galactan 1, 3-beta-galactosidase n=1 Tax=Colletotrichum karsti TaxID=1095194 RepID=A0A9P6LND7_9PEZI|nr:galactan 1, 3-beta-galactosidase [Colletotrichum karsti]KAF9882434.1 galactan 1, 3-beta-galactosidase [Colletotrichum karsti]